MDARRAILIQKVGWMRAGWSERGATQKKLIREMVTV
jgi:hypothetical protein